MYGYCILIYFSHQVQEARLYRLWGLNVSHLKIHPKHCQLKLNEPREIRIIRNASKKIRIFLSESLGNTKWHSLEIYATFLIAMQSFLFAVSKHKHLVGYISAKFPVVNSLFKTATSKISFYKSVWYWYLFLVLCGEH